MPQLPTYPPALYLYAPTSYLLTQHRDIQVPEAKGNSFIPIPLLPKHPSSFSRPLLLHLLLLHATYNIPCTYLPTYLHAKASPSTSLHLPLSHACSASYNHLLPSRLTRPIPISTHNRDSGGGSLHASFFPPPWPRSANSRARLGSINHAFPYLFHFFFIFSFPVADVKRIRKRNARSSCGTKRWLCRAVLLVITVCGEVQV